MPLSKFTCRYALDERLDRDLVNLCQTLYRFVERAIGPAVRLRYEDDGYPDAVQYYLLYGSALIHGAADAALTLTLHNLGREARVFERQVFEIWVKAKFYSENPAEAKKALYATPFHELEILDGLQYTRDSERYQRVLAASREIEARYPGAKSYQEPKVGRILDRSNEELARFYAWHYRIPSQLLHAAFAGAGIIWSEGGVSFDSRERLPNHGLSNIVAYLFAFIDVLTQHFDFELGPDLEELRQKWDDLRPRLQQAMAALSDEPREAR